VDSGDGHFGLGHNAGLVRVCASVRKSVRGHDMIWFTATVALFLFGYLLLALLRPERF
jgi:K+-transporting ATPase KdpF subunit